jgi:5-methylcytosine-specific restriction endonuclease McrA
MKRLVALLVCLTLFGVSLVGSYVALVRHTASQLEEVRRDKALLASPHQEPRSPHWPTVRKHHLEREPACAVCGTKEDLNVHHILSFHTHPELELEDSNLITLCRHDHWVWGHLLDWKADDPDIRQHIEVFKERVRHAKEKLK